MADKTDAEKVKAVIDGSDQEIQIERAFVSPDGTITIPQCEADLVSVDIADVDLLLSFADGTFVIIPNGAIDAISGPPQEIFFIDNDISPQGSGHSGHDHKSSLGDLFKMVGITEVAETGSLRVKSENVDSQSSLEEEELPDAVGNEFVASSEEPLTDEIDAPKPVVEINSGKAAPGMGPGRGAVDTSVKIVETEDPVQEIVTPRPTVYRSGQKTIDTSDPEVTLTTSITADDIVNIAEAGGSIAITGIAGGGAQAGDSITLTVNGTDFVGQALADMTFSIDVAGAALAADPDQTIDAVINSVRGGNPGMDSESYSVDTTAPGPTISLDTGISMIEIIQSAESGGRVEITGVVGGDARVGDTVTLTVNGSDTIGLVQADMTYRFSVPAADLLADGGTTVDAMVTTIDGAGNPGTGIVTADITAQTITLDADITADDIINIAESRGDVTITGVVGADARAGDTVTLTVNGVEFQGQVLADMTFRIEVAGSDLVADSDRTVEASIDFTDAVGNLNTATDSEAYSVDITAPFPTITLDANITSDDVIGFVESGETIAITGIVGGDAQVGDKVTLTVNGVESIGLVQAGKTFSIGVAGADLVADVDKIVEARISSTDAAGNTGTASDTEGYTVNLTPPLPPAVPDVTAPEVTPGQSFNYAEKQVADAVVATVAATDNQGVYAFRFSDSGTDLSADGYFSIAANGQISMTASGAAAGRAQNDFETGLNSFDYGIEAGDAAGNWSETESVTLNVTNIDEGAPVVVSGQVLSYAESQASGAVVGIVVASDDMGVTAYRFSASGGTTSSDGYYTIAANGEVRLTASGVAAGVENNDFETGLNTFIYAVQAGDASGNWSPSENVTFNVTNMDEAAPVMTAGQSFSYAENQAAGAVVGIVASTDDVGVTAYRFTDSGTSTSLDGYYTIAGNGQISLTAAGVAAGVETNDFETGLNSFSYAVEAGDADGNWSLAENITLEVTDLDETVPVVTAGQSFSYAENQAAGAFIGTVVASDDIGITGYQIAQRQHRWLLCDRQQRSHHPDGGGRRGRSREQRFRDRTEHLHPGC